MIIVQYMLNFMTLLEYQAVRSASPTVARKKQHFCQELIQKEHDRSLERRGNGARYPKADEEA